MLSASNIVDVLQLDATQVTVHLVVCVDGSRFEIARIVGMKGVGNHYLVVSWVTFIPFRVLACETPLLPSGLLAAICTGYGLQTGNIDSLGGQLLQ